MKWLLEHTKLVSIAAALIAAFAAGRYSRPERATATKTDEHHTKAVEQVATRGTDVTSLDEAQGLDLRRVRTTVTKPTGEVRTREVDTVSAHQEEKAAEVKTVVQYVDRVVTQDRIVTETKVVEAARARWRLGPMVQADLFHLGRFAFGAHAQYRLLGPFSIGAYGLNNGTVGVLAGLEF